MHMTERSVALVQLHHSHSRRRQTPTCYLYLSACGRTRLVRHRRQQLPLLRCRHVRISFSSSSRPCSSSFLVSCSMFFSYWDCSSPAHVVAHYPYDSSYTTQWASELGIASYTICLTYRVGVSVVCFTKNRAGSALHSYSHGLHSYSVHVSASDGYPCL